MLGEDVSTVLIWLMVGEVVVEHYFIYWGFSYLRISGPPPTPLQNGTKVQFTRKCIVTYTKLEQKYSSARNLNIVVHAT